MMDRKRGKQSKDTQRGSRVGRTKRTPGQEANQLWLEDREAHEWYRFVLSYPPHLVREYIEEYFHKEFAHHLSSGRNLCVLDPFCGTGTTVVESKKLGFKSVGNEATAIGHFATSVKVD